MTLVGLGSDLLRIERIARIGLRNGDLLLTRVLAPAERLALDGTGDVASDWPACAARIAALIAGKEAFFKALGSGLVAPLRWADIAILGPHSNPSVTLAGATEAAFAARGGIAARLAICCSDAFALATVALLGHPPGSAAVRT